jgi:hypothetical protein
MSATLYQIDGTLPNIKQDYSLNAGLSINYFGYIGSANGVTHTLLFPYWFNWLFTLMLLAAGLLALKGSFSDAKTGRRLMIAAGAVAIVCSPLFYALFASNLLSLPLHSSNMLFNIFPAGDFGLNGADLNLHTQTGSSFFWLPIVAGVLAVSASRFFMAKNEPVALLG